MRSNRAQFVVTVALIAMGLTTLLSVDVWLGSSNKHRCQDSIERVAGRLDAATCNSGQHLAYLRDFTGDSYVICKCGEPTGDELNTPEIPSIPGLVIPNDNDKKDEPKIRTKDPDDGGTLL